MDKKSYALGISVGQKVVYDMSTSGIENTDVNVNDLVEGIMDVINKKPLKVDLQEASDELETFVRESVRKFAKKNKEEGEKFLEAFGNQPGAHRTPTGLLYKAIEDSSLGDPISDEDTVLCHIVGAFADGNCFIDTRANNGEPKWFNLPSLIPGLTEGLQLMTNGSRYTFAVPYDLAYGPEGNERFPGYASLMFDVEVLDIKTEE